MALAIFIAVWIDIFENNAEIILIMLVLYSYDFWYIATAHFLKESSIHTYTVFIFAIVYKNLFLNE